MYYRDGWIVAYLVPLNNLISTQNMAQTPEEVLFQDVVLAIGQKQFFHFIKQTIFILF